MKIALISNDYQQTFPMIQGYGGIEIALERLAKGMCEAKLDFFVVTPDSLLPYNPLVPIIRTRAKAANQESPCRFIEDAYDILKIEKPDVIWSVSKWSNHLTKLNIPQIINVHDGVSGQSDYLLNLPHVKYRFLSNSQQKMFCTESWQFEKSFVHNLSMASEEFCLIDKEDYYLMVVGLQWGLQNKGVDQFMQLANLFPNKKFVLYGSGHSDTGLFLKHYSKAHPNFEFRGELLQEQKAEVFGRAKAYLLLSQLKEAGTMVGVEALGYGTVALGYKKAGAVPEVIDNHHGTYQNFDALCKHLDDNFDYKAASEYAQKFHVKHEVEILLKESLTLL
jgi:glycosyltransferase involved in cell wall biosynthesis